MPPHHLVPLEPGTHFRPPSIMSQFPPLVNDTTSAQGSGSIAINFQNTKKVPAFCIEHDISASELLQLTWAIVLHCFTASDRVAFRHLHLCKDDELKCVIRKVTFESSESVIRSLRRFETSSAERESCLSSINTALFVGPREHALQLDSRDEDTVSSFSYQAKTLCLIIRLTVDE